MAGSGWRWHDPPMGSAKKAKKAAKLAERLERLQEAALEAVDPVGPKRLADVLRARPGHLPADVDPAATPGFRGSKEEGAAALASGATRLSDLQERLFAASKGGDSRRVLLVVQGMDTAGKGGIMRHVVGSVLTQG